MDDRLDREVAGAVRDIARTAPPARPLDDDQVVDLVPIDARGRALPRALALVGIVALAALVAGAVWTRSQPAEVGLATSPVDDTAVAPVPEDPISIEFDGSVADAVAPVDHDSNVESQLLSHDLSQAWQGVANRCLVAAGRPDLVVEPFVLERDDPHLAANAQFPNPEVLARDGFPVVPGIPGTPENLSSTPVAPEAVETGCWAQADAEPALGRTRAAFDELRGPWWTVIAEIDESPEVRQAIEAWGACLRANGIPAESTASLGRYFGYLDSLRRAIDGDAQNGAILQEHGRLFARCGEESGLFETRQRLRAERRESFLVEHAAAIDELTTLLQG